LFQLVTASRARNHALHADGPGAGIRRKLQSKAARKRPIVKEKRMQANKTILSLAIASLFAATGVALAYGPGAQGWGAGIGPRAGARMDPALMVERVQFRLAGLKDALKLQPNQLAAWDAYEAKVKSEAQTRAQLHQSVFEQRGDAEAWADHRVTMMKHNAQAAEEINGLRKALVATLSEEQKATFERYAMGPGFMNGPGAGGGPRGYGPGPGYGGGRGPGFGRGCLGAA
jgi:hypothetical protein